MSLIQPSLHTSLPLLIFILAALAFTVGGLIISRFLRPNNPNAEKLKPYESGEEPTGDAWGCFHVRFYIVAIIFLLFDVELVFLFPWARIFMPDGLMQISQNQWGWFMLAEMGVFVAILALGLAWAWAKGYLDWIKPEPQIPVSDSPVPKEMYEAFNERVKGKSG